MYKKDTIPNLSHTEPFPLGDVNDVHKERLANEWITGIEAQPCDQFMRNVRITYAPTAIIGSAAYKTHNAAMNLCKSWDEVKANGSELALSGYKIAMAFTKATHYLPGINFDFVDQLKQMQRPDEQLYRAREFARVAWQGMEQYPHVHDKFEHILDHSRTKFVIQSDENLEYFQAGMALSYILTTAAQLAIGTPDFKGMTGEKVNLRTAEFGQLFY
jgi:hypothetical protein